MRWLAMFLFALLMTTAPAFAETRAEHDQRSNFDGYGSERNRYENTILMKTHDSILKNGKLEYWNGVDDYYYWKYRRNHHTYSRQGHNPSYRRHSRH